MGAPAPSCGLTPNGAAVSAGAPSDGDAAKPGPAAICACVAKGCPPAGASAWACATGCGAAAAACGCAVDVIVGTGAGNITGACITGETSPPIGRSPFLGLKNSGYSVSSLSKTTDLALISLSV